MRLDKRSESSKKFKDATRIAIPLIIIIIIAAAVLRYMYIKGYIHYEITEDKLQGHYGWFFRIVKEQGWASAIVGVVIILVAIFGYFYASERRRKMDDFLTEINKRNRMP